MQRLIRRERPDDVTVAVMVAALVMVVVVLVTAAAMVRLAVPRDIDIPTAAERARRRISEKLNTATRVLRFCACALH